MVGLVRVNLPFRVDVDVGFDTGFDIDRETNFERCPLVVKLRLKRTSCDSCFVLRPIYTPDSRPRPSGDKEDRRATYAYRSASTTTRVCRMA